MGEESRSGVLSGVSKNPHVFEMCGHHSCNYRGRSVALPSFTYFLLEILISTAVLIHLNVCDYITLCINITHSIQHLTLYYSARPFFVFFFWCLLLKDLLCLF